MFPLPLPAGEFAVFPETGAIKLDETDCASWLSHKAETARPYYYSVYLADYDVTTEITPTERAASFRFTFPERTELFQIGQIIGIIFYTIPFYIGAQ